MIRIKRLIYEYIVKSNLQASKFTIKINSRQVIGNLSHHSNLIILSTQHILTNAKTIAIIGASSKTYRTSYMITGYLADAGYSVVPVNPNEESVQGVESYSSVLDLPEDMEVDIVNIFRNSENTLEMVEEIVNWCAGKPRKPVIWTQLYVSTPEAKKLAEENGFTYIENRCIMVDHKSIRT